jgi:hypothetical protein
MPSERCMAMRRPKGPLSAVRGSVLTTYLAGSDGAPTLTQKRL